MKCISGVMAFDVLTIDGGISHVMSEHLVMGLLF